MEPKKYAHYRGLDLEGATSAAKESFSIGRVAYVEACKACIRVKEILDGLSKSERKGKTLFSIMRKAGVRESNVKNGQQLAQVWHRYVVTGDMTEDQFDQLTYRDAVSLNKIHRKSEALARNHLDSPDDWDCLAEHGMTVAGLEEFERKQAAKSKAVPAQDSPYCVEYTPPKGQPAETTEPTAETATEQTEPTVDAETPAESEAPAETVTESEPTATTESEPDAPTAPAEPSTPAPAEPTPMPGATDTAPKQTTGSVDHMPEWRSLCDALEEVALGIATDQPDKMEDAHARLLATFRTITNDVFAEADSEDEEEEAIRIAS